MKMNEVMKQKSFVVVGDTLNEEKFAQIVQELKDRGDISENKE